MSGLVVALVGLVLCFAGVRSLNLAVFVSGFGLAWLLVDSVGSTHAWTAVLIALAGGVVAVVVTRFIVRSALFFVGGVVGTVIGARLYTLLEPKGGNAVVALVFIAAAAFLSGWMSQKWNVKVVMVLTALGGAGIVLSGIGRMGSSVEWLRNPEQGGQQLLVLLLWLAVAALGVVVQRPMLARRLDKS